MSFDKLHSSLIKNRFSEGHSVYTYMTDKDKQDIWGWGPENKVYFKYLDQYHKAQISKKNKPYFVTLSTVNGHYPYDVPIKNQQ